MVEDLRNLEEEMNGTVFDRSIPDAHQTDISRVLTSCDVLLLR